MSEISTIFQNNDTLIELAGLQNETTGAYLNTATVTVTLIDATGANVTGATWPMAMSYVAGSNGLYRATLGFDLPLTENGLYKANIIAIGGTGLRANWTANVICKKRT